MRKKIAMIGGSGHIGVPLALKFASVNYNVVSIDKNVNANTCLNNGQVPFEEPGAEKLLKKKRIIFTDDYSKVKNSDIIIITVDTPMKINNKPNKKVFRVFDQIKNYLKDNLTGTDNVLIKSRVNENYNFNISIEGKEIFAKRRFWNKYPRYPTILNKINGFIKEKQVYAAMKASYQLQNEIY